MKRIISFCIFTFFLIGCSNEYADFEMINMKDPIDERDLIEHTMTEQRKLLKPGFISDQQDWKNGFNLHFQQTNFNQETEELIHTVTYIHAPSDAFLSLLAEKNTNNDRYDETVEQLKDAQPLKEVNGYTGYIEDEGERYYQYIAEEDGVTYYLENMEDEKEGLDENLVSKMGNALKTEDDGAYSYFYDRFEFKLDDLHFPQMDKEYVENVEVEIGDLGHWEFKNNNFIKISYDFGDDTILHFQNTGADLYTSNVSYIEINKEDTAGGVTVTTFDTDLAYPSVYFWEADGHYYVIELESENDTVSTEDIYAIIDSSREDTRKFSDENVFTNINEGPTHSQLDKEILELLLNMTD